ncbi:SLC13 family permease [Pararhodobacter marinus]|uniref:SLC13 family permease n=1 Tax=Pararhodobacter marinus TaxID=2184063 RepID=A0A2U2CGL3_9RHOB|nr:SLC13 family permease [Pararhodobacter marinus]PWE31033.1 SLC13 family permease [Pararhodobacter marinus]
MSTPQLTILAILFLVVGGFLWGRFRHDAVALFGLIACVVTGLVDADRAFTGFGHPAVVTVACVLILSRALQHTGAVDVLARRVLPAEAGRLSAVAALMGLGAALSAFMNNVGAMALLMPLAIQLAGRLNLPPGQVLMPLAFGTIMGGMVTLVGTPPNLIVATFRPDGAFRMFDYTWVGLPVALAGIAFVALIGWRLVPVRRPAGDMPFETGTYLTELRVPEDSKAVGLTLRKFEAELEGVDLVILALIRGTERQNNPHGSRKIQAGDVLIVEAEAKALTESAARHEIALEGLGTRDEDENDDEFVLREFALLPGSSLIGRSARQLRLRFRWGVSLLAVAREGARPRGRLGTLTLKSGDLLLLRGKADVLSDFARDLSCVPLDTAPLWVPDKRKAWLATAIMAAAVLVAAFGILPSAVAFAGGVLATMLTGTLPLRELYRALDGPVIVLLAALIPVAAAMQETGTADLLARGMVDWLAQGNTLAALVVVLVVTMVLSDVMNNAATAAVMAPIALGIAAQLGAGAEGFLMAVAIGASCAFLTPIGHQNNTLILGPGGFRFGDYWKLGLALEAVIVAVSVPLIVLVWGL